MSSLVTANNLINTWNLNGGFLDANFVSTIQGLLEDVNTVYSLANITDLGDEAIILDDTSLTANKLISLDGITSGVIDATAITTLTGAAADLITAYASAGISNLGNEAVSVSSGTASTSQANTLAAATSGIVTATLSDGDLATLAGLTETGNAYSITISDTRVNAEELNALNNETTINIDGSNITQITGAVDDIATAYTAGGITGLGDEEVIFTFANINARSLNAIDAANSRVINASGVAALTGNAAALNIAYASSGISGLGDEPVTLTDTSLIAAVLNTLDGNTSGIIDAASINELTAVSYTHLTLPTTVFV